MQVHRSPSAGHVAEFVLGASHAFENARPNYTSAIVSAEAGPNGAPRL